MTALCGGALALNLVLILGLLSVISWQGARFFWQKDLPEFTLTDGSKILGEIHAQQTIPAATAGAGGERFQIRLGNRDLTGGDFQWIDASAIAKRELPADAVLLERLEWGNFYGRMVELRRGTELLAQGSEAVWKAFPALHETKVALRDEIRELEKGAIGDVNLEIEKLRLATRRLELDAPPADVLARRQAEIDLALAERQAEYETLASALFAQRETLATETLVMEAADGTRKEIPVGAIVRAIRPNEMGGLAKLGLYASRVREFVADEPRESNTEGGIFPAIFGTVMMVFLMSFAVVPLGVLAALYLREYAKQGLLVRTVRIAVNNLAGVPSIVFGVFGLGFFVYTLGGSIDSLFFPEALPTPTFGTGGILWGALTLALLTVPVVIVATEEGLAAVPQIVRAGSLALGATKWETTWKVVLPAAAPGVLTGVILAMARAAGEVAPLMIVGMVKLAPTLPIDGDFPFVHFERKFMHLGFHIYDVGFQSPNVDATKPLVFATALLLILIVTAMNLVAISIRNRLRRKYAGSAV
ncbi:MAG: phosphate ABC transporter permease PstA [Thermoanaerobaculia bacterium]|nr:phosphate ABC transporter permease PstA [Thermoanaerobaculia bacterium]MBP9825133.1 phosphate ABC transporter permease PstA [Thermoanaerobaculia bacterium]